MCGKMCVCTRGSGCEACVNLQQIIWILCLCLCISISYTYCKYSMLRVWCMKWRGTDTYLPWAGLRSLAAGLARPSSSSPAVFLWPPLSLSEALTQTQEDLLHVGSSVDSLAPKQSEAAYSDISLQGNILVSVITQVCQGLTGAVFKIFCEPLWSL